MEILCSEPAESPDTNRASLGSHNPEGGRLGHPLAVLEVLESIFDAGRLSSESKPGLVVGSN